jgi:hypothetical protein
MSYNGFGATDIGVLWPRSSYNLRQSVVRSRRLGRGGSETFRNPCRIAFHHTRRFPDRRLSGAAATIPGALIVDGRLR